MFDKIKCCVFLEEMSMEKWGESHLPGVLPIFLKVVKWYSDRSVWANS